MVVATELLLLLLLAEKAKVLECDDDCRAVDAKTEEKTVDNGNKFSKLMSSMSR